MNATQRDHALAKARALVNLLAAANATPDGPAQDTLVERAGTDARALAATFPTAKAAPAAKESA